MAIYVEFFGTARRDAGVAETTAEGQRLGEVLADLGRRYPSLTNACLDRGQLRPHCLASVGGDRFVRDPEAILRPGDRLLIVSMDAGG